MQSNLVTHIRDSAVRRASGQQVIAGSVQGLVTESIKIISKQVKQIGLDVLAERTETLTGVSINKATINNWITGKTKCPHLNKLNPVLNACGYTLGISRV